MTIDLVTNFQPHEEENDELKNKRVFAGRVFTDDEVKKSLTALRSTTPRRTWDERPWTDRFCPRLGLMKHEARG